MKLTVLPSTAWVPTTMSIAPSAAPFFTSRVSAAPTMRESWPMPTGRPAKRSRKFLVVLAREQGRRRDDHGLLAVDRGGEGGAQRNLGLAETDVAADQPVHRPAGGEIVERRLDRALLVRRLLIGKAGAEFVVETFRDGEARRGVHHPLRRRRG